MLKLGFLTITGCSFWNIFFPPRGGLGPKGCVGRTLMLNNTGSYSSIVNDFGFSAVLLSQKILVSILNFNNRLKDWHFADHFSWAETNPDFFVSIVNWNMSISSCFFNLLAVKSPPTKNWSKRFFLWIISEMQKVQA